MQLFHRVLTSAIVLSATLLLNVAVGQETQSLDQQLKEADASQLSLEARRRGDPHRGALIFYTSAAGCIKCHQGDADTSPLGPDLAKWTTMDSSERITDIYVIESLLYPSKTIRKGYETIRLLTDSGQVISGMFVRENAEEIVLRDAANLEKEITVPKAGIESHTAGKQSMMPEGLIATIRSQREFYDLVSYLFAIAEGGTKVAAELKPLPEQLAIKDDISNLDHAGVLKKTAKDKKSFESGQRIFNGLCSSCHGIDGKLPSLATARAFGTQKLKYGSDPYRMFMTLSNGNGLMAATTYLAPRERYDVVQYIRERFLKGSDPDYEEVTPEYLNGLPKGIDQGDFKPAGDRDYGPALASQLGRDIASVLTVKLGSLTLSYNLHTLDQAEVWTGGFLDLNQTQHQRPRGEGYPTPIGPTVQGLEGWQWAHDGTFDYPRENLLPRGPLPQKWLQYKGHFLHEDKLVLAYQIDGREVLELPNPSADPKMLRRVLKIGAGRELLLATARVEKANATVEGVMPFDSLRPTSNLGSARSMIAVSGQLTGKSGEVFAASRVLGDVQGMSWTVDRDHRLTLRIPADDKPRLIEIGNLASDDPRDLQKLANLEPTSVDPSDLIQGGKARWDKPISTVGYLGLEKSAYVADTITIPEATPWNSWMRTTAIDFFPDGRLVVTTHGGDVWIVSGIDHDLLNLRWRRFAGGLYEPFGVKVVDGLIYVTCKDRLTRLHDLNNDGEADFYESFFADTDVSTFFHAFNFDLQTDKDGNFYYAKAGQYTSYALPGSLMKISPDGTDFSIFCTGFRTPNGMGMMADGRMTVSDNQGTWMPASKISLVKQGGFYGYVQNKASGKSWAPDGGRIDHTKVVPPTTFDQPIIWMPQDLDNSSGGQVWVDDPRWGPLTGHLLHTSFGKGWLSYLMIQDLPEVSQAAIVKLPIDFSTGIMRGRVNPVDGQVYVTGLNGWNENGRPGLQQNGIERVRYTGRPLRMVSNCQVQTNGLRLSFNFTLDEAVATDVGSYAIEQWNYKWTGNYGSDIYHPETGAVGTQTLNVKEVKLAEDKKSVELIIPEIRPVNQLHLKVSLKDTTGQAFQEQVYWTINAIPKTESH